MRHPLPLAFVLALVGCNGPTLTEPADVPADDVALDFNPGDARADLGGCPQGFTCTPTDAGTDTGVDVQPVDTGIDVQTVDAGTDVQAIDIGFDVAPVDSGVDVQPVDNGVDVQPSCVSMTVGNCGGVACMLGQNVATAACVACACGVGTCARGWGDCDHDPANGCETDLAFSGANCGACGAPCAAGLDCADGACLPCSGGSPSCGSGGCFAFRLCGACVNVETSPANCGACGVMCAPGYSCSRGACIPNHP